MSARIESKHGDGDFELWRAATVGCVPTIADSSFVSNYTFGRRFFSVHFELHDAADGDAVSAQCSRRVLPVAAS
jgi:hypothetical protein